VSEIPFLITGKNVSKFKEIDPFNPSNIIEGYLCKTPDLKYGMLYINRVNGLKVDNIVWATPKMFYPVDRNGNWVFPKVREVRVYEKYDGTNILGYRYHDHDGNQFVTYKTRLRPILSDGKYGNFKKLWDKILDMYPEIPELILKSGCNISFELFGKKNKHLVEYPMSLDTRILFARFDDGFISVPDIFESSFVPIANLIKVIDGNTDLPKAYDEIKEYLNQNLKIDKRIIGNEEEDWITGMEGSVWYAIGPEKYIQYKCKPKYVEDLHFKWACGIPKHSIYTTVINSFEDTDDPTFEYIVELLKEEYEESDIYKKSITIKRILDDIKFEMNLKHKIIEDYKKNEFDINKDKRNCMRFFGENYDKKLATKIFILLQREYGD